jgi:hypothetical protein
MTRPLLQTRATYVLTHPKLRWHRYKSGHHRYATEAIDVALGRCNGAKTCWFKLRRPNATKFSSLGALVRCGPAMCIANIEVSVSLSTRCFLCYSYTVICLISLTHTQQTQIPVPDSLTTTTTTTIVTTTIITALTTISTTITTRHHRSRRRRCRDTTTNENNNNNSTTSLRISTAS